MIGRGAKYCDLLCLFQVIEYSDDEEESKARASRKKERYEIKLTAVVKMPKIIIKCLTNCARCDWSV